MLEPQQFITNDNYVGSRAFTWLADLCGLSVDLINFLLCQILALLAASLFRSVLHPSKVSSAVRHTFALTLGLAFGYFCFGKQAIHIAGLPTVCYVVIRTQSPAVVQRNVMLVAMTYLLCIHLIRQIYDYGSYSLDITAPLMIITQKVTSLAFSIHDGFVRETEELTKAQQYHAVQKLPSALEYFSYVWHFQGLMAGPLVFYKDYIDFVEGYNLLKHPASNGNLDNSSSKLVLEPSPMKAVVKKVIGSMICAFIFMKFVKMYPLKNMKDDDFIENTSIFYKFWYVMMSTTSIRFKYYHAWLLSDAICNNSGLGFTGYDKDGDPKWDLISNINVLSFEFATNMRDAINNWNIGTNRWLRTIVYERVPKKYGTMLTFALSAVWHGFYPGYYLTFATGALMVTSARVARRLFRYRFQKTQFTRMCYDILTCLTTRLVMGYTTFPFVLLEFVGGIRMYLKFYFCLHIAAIVVIYILPKFIRGERRTPRDITSEEQLTNPQKTSTSLENNIMDNVNTKAPSSVNLENKKQLMNGNHVSQRKENDLNEIFLNTPTRRTTSNLAPLSPMVAGTVATKTKPKPLCAREAVSVPHDQCEMDQLSSKLREKIDAETKNIEEFIDKTVTETVSGIVEFKKDLMRAGAHLKNQEGLRKRAATMIPNGVDGVKDFTDKMPNGEESAAFLKKEIDAINAVVQQANVLPVVLSNGHAK